MSDTILHQVIRTSLKLSKSTRTTYLVDIDQWVKFAGANPRNWTRYRAQEFYNSMLTRMKPQSANRVMAALAHASSWWAKKENNPALHFAVVQTAKDTKDVDPETGLAVGRHALNQEDAMLLLATCKDATPIDMRDFALFVVGLETGMRKMSLASITFENIQRSKDGYPVANVPIKGSGDELYSVPMSDCAIEAIAPWRGWLKTQKVTKGPLFRTLTREIARSGRLMYEPTDTGLSLPAIYKVVTRRAADAGLEHVHPHIFRNTFVTWRIEAGLTPFQIAAVTGHKMANIPGMASMGSYIDAARLGDAARQSTPMWLWDIVRKS